VAGTPSAAYELFHPAVQRWIYDAGWQRLYAVQERAAARILAGDRDVILAAATAGGKSEAAWLPICSTLARSAESGEAGPGIQAMVISPLKALINDQYERLVGLCERLALPVHRWHGDVPGSRKSLVLRAPAGVLLITPESIEAMFVRHPDRVGRVLADLRYIVIDELHSFIGTQRGAQLQSLLNRIELRLGRRVPRIALSATLGDLAAAAEFLRPGHGDAVELVTSAEDGGEVRLQVRGYLVRAARPTAGSGAKAPPEGSDRPDPSTGSERPGRPRQSEQSEPSGQPEQSERHAGEIADHVFAVLRHSDNLVFANSRAAVERYADLLSQRSRAAGSRAEFLAHHGSLARDIREHVEQRLKDPSRPATAVCTSTLELGIDVGSVDSVVQLGAPLTVSSLRQRLGRSGRRPGRPAVLRVYLWESETTSATSPPDALRGELFQTVAMVELLLAGWFEPAHLSGLHLSTLVQQVLSVLAGAGGARADQLYRVLCGTGPFGRVDRSMFATLLRDLGRHELVQQDSRGLLLPGSRGDRLVNHYSFYAAFQTSPDYRLVAAGRTIGTLPVERPLAPGTLMIFGGRRWRVIDVDPDRRVIQLTPSGSGQPPSFAGNGSETADEVRRTMRALYLSEEVPRYLDEPAQRLLREGRENFHRHGHARQHLFDWRGETLVFPWRGDRIMNTLQVMLTSHGFPTGQDGLCLTVKGTSAFDLWTLVQELAQGPLPEPVALARTVRVKTRDKYDRYLGEELLDQAYAARALDVPGTWDLLAELAALPPPTGDVRGR
jgi:ATP-dependent Lhr-like helicase